MQVVCGHCGWTIDSDGREPGEAMACPRCGEDVRFPRLEGDGDCEPVAGFAEQVREAMKSAPTARVTCGGCGHSFKVGLRMCGRAVRCPSCQAAVRIPYPEEPEETQRVAPEANTRAVVAPERPSVRTSEDTADAAVHPLRRGWTRLLLAVVVLAVAVVAGVLMFR